MEITKVIDLQVNPIRYSIIVDGREVWSRKDERHRQKDREQIAREQDEIADRIRMGTIKL